MSLFNNDTESIWKFTGACLQTSTGLSFGITYTKAGLIKFLKKL